MDGWTWDAVADWIQKVEHPRSEVNLPLADFECKRHGQIDCEECSDD